MLDIMRKHAGSWWIKAILIAVALSFVIGFGILNRVSNADRSRYVIKVGDTIVTPDEFSDLMMRGEQDYYQKYGTDMSDNDRINLQTSLLNGRIDLILETKEANHLGLVVSDREVADVVAAEPGFWKDGAFDYDTYTQYLEYEGLSEKMFEEQIRQALLVQKLKDIVTDSVKVSDDEVIEMSQSQGKSIKDLSELSPDEKEYFSRLALAVKRFSVYRKFLDSLQAQETVDINQDYLLAQETK